MTTADVKLTDAQYKVLSAMQQGRDFRSGPHLAKLAELGLIDRTGKGGRYEATQAGIRRLLEERRMQPCRRGNDDCPLGCCD